MSVIFLQYESMIRPYFTLEFMSEGDDILALRAQTLRTLSTRKTLVVVELFEEELLVLRGPDTAS